MRRGPGATLNCSIVRSGLFFNGRTLKYRLRSTHRRAPLHEDLPR